MHINGEISIGNIITTVITIVTVLVAYHRWDKKIETRHTANGFRMKSLEDSFDRAQTSIHEMQVFVGGLWKELMELKGRFRNQ